MDYLKSFSRRDWIVIAIFCLAMFVVGDSATIRGGVCPSSPCSTLNGSFTDNGTVDHFFDAYSNPLIAPTAGFSYLYFKDNPNFEFGIGSRPYSFSLDAKYSIENGYVSPKDLLDHDRSFLPRIFLIHKIFVLLSLPLWLGSALLLRFILRRKTRWANAILWLLIALSLVVASVGYLGATLEGDPDDTLRMFF